MATIGMQYIHVMMGEDGLVSPRAGYRTCTFYYCQRLATIGMQYAHVPMGEDGLVPPGVGWGTWKFYYQWMVTIGMQCTHAT